MTKKKQTKTNKPTDTTEYRVYSDPSEDNILVDKLLDLFVHAYMYTLLDIPSSKRSNEPPIVEITEEDLEQWLKNN